MSEHGNTTSNIALRIVGAAGLAGIALIHLVDVPDKFEEVPYLGVMYIGLIVASAITAIVLLMGRQDRKAWTAAGLLAGATFIGYCLSRTTGLPAATEDVGNWGETLGVLSLIVEGAVVGLAMLATNFGLVKNR